MVIILCFSLSGALRLWETGTAIAKEMAELPETETDGTQNASNTCPPPFEPESMLISFQNREKELDALEEKLMNREQILKVARIKIEDQLAKLEEAENKLSSTLAQADGAAEKDLERLTTVYENMKPKEASVIFETMDIDFAAGFLMRMRPDSAAAILSSLDSNTAYAISIIMAGRNLAVPTE